MNDITPATRKDDIPVAMPERQRLLDYRWLAEKFGLFITPAIAYYLVFTYESAYCRNFGIPPGFIRPDLTTILIYTSVVVGVSCSLVMILDSWIELHRASPASPPAQHLFRLYLPFILLLLLLVSTYGSHWRNWFWLAIILAIGTLTDFIKARFGDKKKPYLTRLQGPVAIFNGPGTIWDIARKRLDLELVIFFIAMFFARLISSSLGEAEALNQHQFLVPSSHPDSVLVRIYGDKMLCAAYDPKTKKLAKQFFILTAGTDQTLHFDTKEIGTLSLE